MVIPAPLAPYLFVLRKHAKLVLGVVVAVLAAGYLYGKNSPEEFRSIAKVQVVARPTWTMQGGSLQVKDDPALLADLFYRVRSDPKILGLVLGKLREGPLDPEVLGRIGEPEFRALAAGLDPGGLAGMVSMSMILTTSYCEVRVDGGNRLLTTAVANGFADAVHEVFDAENRARFQSQAEGAEKRLDDQIDVLKTRVTVIDGDLTTIKKANPRVDFVRKVNPDLELQSGHGQQLASVRLEIASLDLEVKGARAALEAEGGLRLEAPRSAAGALYRILPVHEGTEPEKDPRLSFRVQALPGVASNENVRKVLEQIEAKGREDQRLDLAGRKFEDLDRQRVRTEVLALQKGKAAATEAALCELARRLDERTAFRDAIQKSFDGLGTLASAAAGALADAERLESEKRSRETEMADLRGRLARAQQEKKATLDEASGGIGSIRVFQRATLAGTAQVRPDRPQIYLVTALVALLVAAGLAYLLEYLDDTVKTREDFDHLVRGVPFLGFVPAIREEGRGRDLVAVHGKTGTPETEAFRALRTAIQFSRPDGEVRSFVLTSAGPAEGKTTVAANLAAIFAAGGNRTLLVDADLRRARVHAAVGVENRAGLTNVLVAGMRLQEAVQPCPGVPGLDVLTSGPIPPNPAEILGSARMREFLAESARTYDRVVIDSPPLSAVTDPCLLAKYVDAVFLVISRGRTSSRLIQRAREALAGVGVRLHGAILNNADLSHPGYEGYYGGYYYGYGYAPKDDREKAAPAKR